jgi:hypothetical protein
VLELPALGQLEGVFGFIFSFLVDINPSPTRWECGNPAPWFLAEFPRGVISTALFISVCSERSDAACALVTARLLSSWVGSFFVLGQTLTLPHKNLAPGSSRNNDLACPRPETPRFLAQGLAVHLDAVSIVHQAVQNAVGQRGIANLFVPLGDGQLAGQNGRARLIAVFADFQEVAPLAFPERSMRPIIHDQHICAGQSSQLGSQAPIGAGQGQVAKPFGGADEESAAAISASLLGQRAGQPAFPDPSRA